MRDYPGCTGGPLEGSLKVEVMGMRGGQEWCSVRRT